MKKQITVDIESEYDPADVLRQALEPAALGKFDNDGDLVGLGLDSDKWVLGRLGPQPIQNKVLVSVQDVVERIDQRIKKLEKQRDSISNEELADDDDKRSAFYTFVGKIEELRTLCEELEE